MNKVLFLTVIVTVLFVQVFTFAPYTLAQSSINDPYFESQQNTGVRGTTDTSGTTFDWRWVLPLLAIPLLLLLLNKRSNEDQEEVIYTPRGQLIGTKGGRASTDPDDDDL